MERDSHGGRGGVRGDPYRGRRSPAVSSVLDAILPALGPGKAVVQSSTIDPESAAACEARVRASGALYVESPFTGSKPAAESGTIVFFMGGDVAALDAVEPLLALVSETRFRLPGVRQAAALKLAMNLNIAAQMEALSESLTFARRAGIDDDFYFQVLAKNVSSSGLARLKEGKLKTPTLPRSSPSSTCTRTCAWPRPREVSACPCSEPCANVWRAPRHKAWATTISRR